METVLLNAVLQSLGLLSLREAVDLHISQWVILNGQRDHWVLRSSPLVICVTGSGRPDK